MERTVECIKEFYSIDTLKGANLEHTNWSGVDLSDLDLQGANFEFSNLRWCNLSNANLKRAELRHACLHDVNLNGANLQCADLRNAHLEGVDFQDTNLMGASITNVHLEDTKGLIAFTAGRTTCFVHKSSVYASLGVYVKVGDTGAALTYWQWEGYRNSFASENSYTKHEIDTYWKMILTAVECLQSQ